MFGCSWIYNPPRNSMSNKNMCTNISNSRVVKKWYILRLNALTSEVTLLTIVVALDLCLVLLSTLALLVLCYLAFSRPKVTSSFGIPPLFFAFRPECLPLPKLGDKEGVLVRPYELCLKLKMTKNISKSLDILTMCQNKLHLPPSRFRQWTYHRYDLLFIREIIASNL